MGMEGSKVKNARNVVIWSGAGWGFMWAVWDVYGFWWALLYGAFWPIWVSYHFARWMLAFTALGG